MHKQFYFLSPVEVVKVTSQNLDEVAEWCGGTVQETESRRVPGRMDKYVWVPTPKGNNISWAFPGMFITKRLVVTVKGELRATWAVFRRDYFEKNYFASNSDAGAATWERELLEAQKTKKGGDVHVTVNVADAMTEALEKAREISEELAHQVKVAEEVVEVETVVNGVVLDKPNQVAEATPEDEKVFSG